MPRKLGKKTPPTAWNPTLASDPQNPTRISTEITVEDWIESGERAFGESSTVHSLAYDVEEQKLYVWFLQNSGGYYTSVPIDVAMAFFGANSLGRFVHQRLKNSFGYIRF